MGTQPQQATKAAMKSMRVSENDGTRKALNMSLSHLLSFSRFFFCTSKLRLYVKQVCDRVFKKSTY